ncbi:MAG: stage II sporulation protein M, partial [Deltaproteobacteria bacterium]|nr:stage II sporulation protein M [Deltaproteobacteria bacterium]
MNINEFVSERKKDWEKLETLADRIGPGARSRLTGSELWELGTLYTAAVSDLSVMRSSASAQGVDPDVLEYLNSLVIRVHGIIYRKPPFRWSAVRWFVVEGFPGTFRDNSAYVGVSAALFLLFGLLGFIMSLNDPGFIELLVPEDLIAKVEKGQVWFTDLYTVAPLASSWLMTHNISVTFLMVASGITFGVGTMYLLAVNGLLL